MSIYPYYDFGTGGGGGPSFTNYDVWNFEDNLTSNTSLTFSLDSAPTSNSYTAGKIGTKCLELQYNNANRFFKITNPGSRFKLSWDNPFCWSFWLNNSSSNGIVISLSSGSGTYDLNNAVYEVKARRSLEMRLANYYGIGDTTNEDLQLGAPGLATNTWHFYYFRYNPVEPKKLYYGRNDLDEVDVTYGHDFEATVYDSSWTLGIHGFNTISTIGKLDQLAFWHTTARSRADMLALYNSGAGTTL